MNNSTIVEGIMKAALQESRRERTYDIVQAAAYPTTEVKDI